jgi:hypothetical protein
MQLSKLSYYSDFVVYPLVLVTLTAININHATWASRTEWLDAGVAGLVLWTLERSMCCAGSHCTAWRIFRPCAASSMRRRWP